MTFNEEITALALDLAKSLWAELGISGSPCRHDWQAVDLEPLIVFTASLAGTDPAFIGRTVSWCAANSSYMSGLRLRFISHRFGVPAAALDPFVRAGTSPPPAAEGTGQGPNLVAVETPDLKRPALIQLRLRALMGVGPRAEALRLFLADPDLPRSANTLARDAGYRQGAMGIALSALTAAGIVKTGPEDGVKRFRLSRPAEIAVAVNGVPVAFPDWMAVLTVICAVRAYARVAERNPAGRTAAARKLVSALRDQFGQLGVSAQVPAIRGESSVTAFEEWAISFVGEQAGATRRAAAHEASYSVHRLALGGWIATVTVAGGQPRPLALSDEPLLRPERRTQRRPRKDPTSEAAAVVEMMLQDLLTRAVQRRLGSTVSQTAAKEPHLHGMSRDFATELLLPMQAGQAAAFSEKFLQHWLANHRHWHDISA